MAGKFDRRVVAVIPPARFRAVEARFAPGAGQTSSRLLPAPKTTAPPDPAGACWASRCGLRARPVVWEGSLGHATVSTSLPACPVRSPVPAQKVTVQDHQWPRKRPSRSTTPRSTIQDGLRPRLSHLGNHRLRHPTQGQRSRPGPLGPPGVLRVPVARGTRIRFTISVSYTRTRR